MFVLKEKQEQRQQTTIEKLFFFLETHNNIKIWWIDNNDNMDGSRIIIISYNFRFHFDIGNNNRQTTFKICIEMHPSFNQSINHREIDHHHKQDCVFLFGSTTAVVEEDFRSSSGGGRWWWLCGWFVGWFWMCGRSSFCLIQRPKSFIFRIFVRFEEGTTGKHERVTQNDNMFTHTHDQYRILVLWKGREKIK